MTKVTRKVFAVIEFIAAQGGRGVLPSELVKALNINQATCIRILKDLLELGYLDQISRQRGYTLGPMMNWLSGNCHYKTELVKAADPLIKELAGKVGQSVLLAILHGGKRFILCHHNFNSSLKVDISAPFYDDLYTTATGRVLLAFASEAERKFAVKTKGLPTDIQWNGADSETGLAKELGKIKTERIVQATGITGSLFIISCPVFKNGEFEAAIGMSIPITEMQGKSPVDIIAALQDTAAKIDRELLSIESIG